MLTPPAISANGTVHNVKRQRPPHFSSWLVRVHSIPGGRLTASVRRANRDAGRCMKRWAPEHGSVTNREMKVGNSLCKSLISSEHASAQSAWERFWFFSRNFEILWRLRSSSQNTRGRTNTAATWQVPLPGSAWRDAARPENDVWSSYSGGGYVGMFLSILYFRNQAKKKYLVHYYLLPC